ncbi:MAG: hypothetical protein HC836_10400 [Richelia sp. RM2_1_2]|nr:hypothetical protein [Richelia sp. SM2_1_7]NJM17364.1 hypothetical protein [Richelia sp. SM1_7_0]NJN13468.1 hypothetical protein [Richelia sp. RM1_1_1]NJO26873.1 hypothetical protein [Richelia sp. SL_2_1]NJO58732.1 hypothetical protein [Richelia sp. RM2_1_2]
MSDEQIYQQLKTQALKSSNSFELLPHQQLWKLQFIIADGSCWEIVALSDDRKTITARWVNGKTQFGVLNFSGERVGGIAVKDVVEIFDDF